MISKHKLTLIKNGFFWDIVKKCVKGMISKVFSIPFFISLFGTIFILKLNTFSTVSFPHISVQDIKNELNISRLIVNTKSDIEYNNTGINTTDISSFLPQCPLVPFANEVSTYIVEDILLQGDSHDHFEKFENFKIGQDGWSPSDCLPVHQVALIIPYRNRPEQLNIFINYISVFLQLQKISYRIFVIEQVDDKPFNRGSLLNIGYLEALKIKEYNCFILHDVDLLPEDLANVYGCTQRVRHMSAVINSFRYTLLYEDLCGGALAITSDQFVQVNGFSNRYFGWGGEDDDFCRRLKRNGLELIRFAPTVSSYRMLPHKKELPNTNRFKVLSAASNEQVQNKDGVASTKYLIANRKIFKLYTLIQVIL